MLYSEHLCTSLVNMFIACRICNIAWGGWGGGYNEKGKPFDFLPVNVWNCPKVG